MKTNRRISRKHWLGLSLLALPYCALAQAPAADSQATADTDKARPDKSTEALEKVTVTATRRAEPLQTSSISATVLSGDELIKSGVSVVDQLQYVTPSTAA